MKVKDRKYYDWSREQYFSHKAVNATLIKTHEIDGAPFAKPIWDGTVADEETDAKRRGTILHLAMQLPDDWRDAVAVMPDKLVYGDELLAIRDAWWDESLPKSKQRTKATLEPGDAYNAKFEPHRQWMSLLKEKAVFEDKTWMTPEEYRICCQQVIAINRNPAVREYASPEAKREVAVTAVHRPTGLELKCLADYLLPDVCLDFKTTRMRHPAAFKRDAIGRGYPYQGALYRMILGVEKFIWVVVRNDEPVYSMVYSLKSSEIESYAEANERALYSINDCINSDNWLPLGWGSEEEL